MKKFLLIAVLAFVGGGGIFAQTPEWKVTGTEGGARARDNQVTLKKGENYVYIYFDPSKVEYDKIKLDFTITNQCEVIWQCVYMPGGHVLGSEVSIGKMDKGPIETSFEGFTKVWSGKGPAKAANLSGVCLKVNDPVGKSVFKVTDVQWVGLK
jgi:hypothetical protein